MKSMALNIGMWLGIVVVLAIIAGIILYISNSNSYKNSGTNTIPYISSNNTYSTVQTTLTTTQQTTTISNSTTTQSSTLSSTTTAQKVDRFTVIEKEYSYSPSVLTVDSGDQVIIATVDSGSASHDLIIQGINDASTPVISPGQNDTFSFTAPAPGNYIFFCSVDGHRQLGMVGTLVVR